MFERIRELYLQSRKPHDIFWNTYVCRPLAAVVLYFLGNARITPNQVTFVSLAVALVGDAILATTSTPLSLWVAVLILEASYVLDCVDGQLARLKNMTSPVGAHLDFLMDELKAYALLGAASVRMAKTAQQPELLLVGVAGVGIVASAISLTTFMRRPEYAPPPPPTGFAPPPRPSSLVGRAVQLVMKVAQTIAHYPSYLVLVALFQRIELFVYPYIVVHALYVLRSLGQIFFKLSRPYPVAPVAVADPEAAVIAALDQDADTPTTKMTTAAPAKEAT